MSGEFSREPPDAVREFAVTGLEFRFAKRELKFARAVLSVTLPHAFGGKTLEKERCLLLLGERPSGLH